MSKGRVSMPRSVAAVEGRDSVGAVNPSTRNDSRGRRGCRSRRAELFGADVRESETRRFDTPYRGSGSVTPSSRLSEFHEPQAFNLISDNLTPYRAPTSIHLLRIY